MEAIRVAIAGAGNVAAHLAAGIAKADGYELVAVARLFLPATAFFIPSRHLPKATLPTSAACLSL